MRTPARAKPEMRLGAPEFIALAAAASVALASTSRAGSEMADWEHDWVALTVARNGTWGSAIHSNLTWAMMQAIKECSRKSGPIGNDCGSEITTVRAAWSLAYACGDDTFIATGETTGESRIAAIHRAIDLRQIFGFELPACKLVVGVGPDGQTPPPGTLSEILPVIGSGR